MYCIDFETYWTKEYSLSKVTTEMYIRDPQFEVIGLCIQRISGTMENPEFGPITWISGTHDEIKAKLDGYHLENEFVLAHNAAFDMAILNWIFDIRPKFILDTLSMARPVTGVTVGGSLRNLSEFFGLGHKGTEVYNTLGKHLCDFAPEELEAFADYCKQDVNLTSQLLFKLWGYVPVKELRLIDLTIRMFTEPVLELDKAKLEAHYEKLLQDKKALLDSVGHGDRDAFMSNDKFAELLRAEGVEPPTKISPKTGKAAYAFAKTDKGLQELAEHPNERVQALVACRLGVKSTIEETRTKAFMDIADRGTLPIMLNYYGAVNTGRWSGGDGLNPQNLPRGGVLRASIRAPEGYSIVACDSSQIEARTLAWFAGQDDLVAQFRANADVYSNFASIVYGKPINKHDNPTERFVGKTATLGLGYSVGAAKLQYALHNGLIRVDVPLEEAKRIVDVYRMVNNKIPKLWAQCQLALTTMMHGYDAQVGTGIVIQCHGKTNSVDLPNGMRLQYPEMYETLNDYGKPEITYRKGKYRNRIYGGAFTENLVQALARIVVSDQMLEIASELRKLSATHKKIFRVVHMVHDEIICVVPTEFEKFTCELMERIMSKAPSWAEGLPVSCESGSGKTYGDAK